MKIINPPHTKLVVNPEWKNALYERKFIFGAHENPWKLGLVKDDRGYWSETIPARYNNPEDIALNKPSIPPFIEA